MIIIKYIIIVVMASYATAIVLRFTGVISWSIRLIDGLLNDTHLLLPSREWKAQSTFCGASGF